jgi:hypothetical protein
MKSDDELRAEDRAIREKLAAGAEARLRRIPGVVHVSVGAKQKAGALTGQMCIRVYVDRKRSRAEVPADELVPAEIDGIPTDVNVVVGQFRFQDDNSRQRPIRGGIQISNRIIDFNDTMTGTQIARGTLGFIATDKTDRAPVLVSNWHVLYANFAIHGDKVYQPAPLTLAPIAFADVPMKPKDDVDKIGVLRRYEISEKCDGAIAAIDVSSCCHCCGIHYANDIPGLQAPDSVTHVMTPPRETIVDKATAVGTMKVYKRGQKTLRSEGTVVDPHYPNFSITEHGSAHQFTGQIAIENSAGNTTPFSDKGDSGSAIISGDNKIVGLLFASAEDHTNTPTTYRTIANHIDDVLSLLNIEIPFSPDVKIIAGERVPVHEAPIPEPYRALRERLQQHENTARLLALGQRHADEVTYLVNHCKPVTIAWHKAHGPAILATVMGAVRDGHYRLPASVKGTAPYEAVERMREVLSRYGSPALREHVGRGEAAPLLQELKACTDIHEVIDRIAGDERLRALLRGIE